MSLVYMYLMNYILYIKFLQIILMTYLPYWNKNIIGNCVVVCTDLSSKVQNI